MAVAAIILNWIQSAGVVAALVFTALEVRARKKELHFRNYLDGIGGFIQDTKLLVENKDLHALYSYSPNDIVATYEQLSDAQKSLVHYCDSIIARCETVWLASRKRWIAEDEWHYWRIWVQQLGGSAEFRWTVEWAADDYAEEFIEAIRGDVKIGLARLINRKIRPKKPNDER